MLYVMRVHVAFEHIGVSSRCPRRVKVLLPNNLNKRLLHTGKQCKILVVRAGAHSITLYVEELSSCEQY